MLLVEEHGRVRVLRLNRPEKRNALNGALVEAIIAGLRAADETDSIAAVVIAGAGAGFSAGADLGERAGLDDAARQARSALNAALMAAPAQTGKPVVAAVQGAVVGAGASLALSCDMVVAAEGARFLYPEAKHGIYPSLVAPMLLRALGPKDCFELLTTGRPLPAEEARALRLVNRVVPEAALLETACALAETAATYGPEKMRRIKAMLNAEGAPR
ncbi:enoyl-CoA hydratase/isomerase family protein [Siccirubricoccus sp. KC 17139]|uniref:Enoyl-CoA hydratase/isomerase family protein n=1 Tax=Siccirubricoccus soli TaxID=2899147 RepID=A0ABT1D149_9PROT|nr:enoyl-CoA hydratase/isomerase family protein [Siccirubricoccus soli]MCP2681774.1 enoyl-CoA hydratase/isomerase family protein [Siccirubricoccus soli]